MMLNSYYKMFDDSMSKYQVYKVNCVNDSHMIVAGLPPAEGDHHVTQIASMALNIISNTNKWEIYKQGLFINDVTTKYTKEGQILTKFF